MCNIFTKMQCGSTSLVQYQYESILRLQNIDINIFPVIPSTIDVNLDMLYDVIYLNSMFDLISKTLLVSCLHKY